MEIVVSYASNNSLTLENLDGLLDLQQLLQTPRCVVGFNSF